MIPECKYGDEYEQVAYVANDIGNEQKYIVGLDHMLIRYFIISELISNYKIFCSLYLFKLSKSSCLWINYQNTFIILNILMAFTIILCC